MRFSSLTKSNGLISLIKLYDKLDPPVFIIGKPKPQVIFDNKMLEQVHQTLSKIGVKSKLVKYQSKTIGIA
jgi:hypothetical protein